MAVLLLRGSPSFALDAQPAAFAAYSLRRLRRGYNGPLVNVRRSSDSVTQDFYAGSRGSLSVAGLTSFLGGGNGFITKWYDQSGNARDAAQATTANQPQIALARSTLNSRPALLYGDATNFRLDTASITGDIWAAGGFYSSVFDLVSSAPTVQGRAFVRGISASILNPSPKVIFQAPASTTAGSWQTTAALATGGHVVDISYSSAALANFPTIAFDGSGQATTNTQPVGTISSETGSFEIGNIPSFARGFPGYQAEQLFFAAQPSAAQLAALRANQKAYWGTP